MSALAQSDAFSPTDFTRPAVNPWLIAFTVMLATFMEVLDTSIGRLVATPQRKELMMKMSTQDM